MIFFLGAALLWILKPCWLYKASAHFTDFCQPIMALATPETIWQTWQKVEFNPHNACSAGQYKTVITTKFCYLRFPSFAFYYNVIKCQWLLSFSLKLKVMFCAIISIHKNQLALNRRKNVAMLTDDYLLIEGATTSGGIKSGGGGSPKSEALPSPHLDEKWQKSVIFGFLPSQKCIFAPRCPPQKNFLVLPWATT